MTAAPLITHTRYSMISHAQKRRNEALQYTTDCTSRQFSDERHALLLEGGTSNTDIAPDTKAYTSIAREVLAASIVALAETILVIDRTNSCENIGKLCKITSTVFQNNAFLCQKFWSDWDVYSSIESSAAAFPICKLLDAAHCLTVAALKAFGQAQVSSNFFMQAVAPFFQLLSILCLTSEMVETTVAMFPEGLVRQSLQSTRDQFQQAQRDLCRGQAS